MPDDIPAAFGSALISVRQRKKKLKENERKIRFSIFNSWTPSTRRSNTHAAKVRKVHGRLARF
jgi:hypothetical protein